MTDHDDFERTLGRWFESEALPPAPAGHLERALDATRDRRPRPAWLSRPGSHWVGQAPGRTLGREVLGRLSWRTIALLAILALLLVGALAALAGSQPRLPAPFGLAADGLVAYGKDGDIFTVDPATGTRRAIVAGPETDHDPRWSLDGTRLVFLRARDGGDVLVITRADGSDRVVLDSTPLVEVDTDSLSWSPDGRTIAVAANLGGARTLYLFDTTSGKTTTVGPGYREMEIYWRPPDGRQLMFLGGTEPNLGLFLFSLDGGRVQEIVRSDGDHPNLRPDGWTPDGRRFAFERWIADLDGYRTHVLEMATGAETVLDVAYGHVSNDGTRIAGIAVDQQRYWVCVTRIDGGPCVRIGQDFLAPDGTHAAGLQWSPNDEWILAQLAPGGPAVILDANGSSQAQRSWPADGAETWQRVAP